MAETESEMKQFQIANSLSDNTKKTQIKLPRKHKTPTNIYSWFEMTLQTVDLQTQTFDCSIEMNLFWKDYNFPNVFPQYQEREFIIHPDYLPIKIDELFENGVTTDITVEPTYKYFEETSTIYMSVVVDCKLSEEMELQRFPMDRQFLNIEFNARLQAVIEGDSDWNWILDFPEWMPTQLQLFHKPFAVRSLSAVSPYQTLSPWVDFSCEQPLMIRLRVQNEPSYWFVNIIFPNFLMVTGCFAGAFAIPLDTVADRLSVSVTLLLAAVAYRIDMGDYMPPVAYLTVMDYYLLSGFVLIILIIFENSIVGYHGFDIDVETAEICDYVFAAIFGGFWVLLHFVAIIVFYCVPDFGRISWAAMDEIDNCCDEADEFLFASPDSVRSNEPVEDEWGTYQSYSPVQRAEMYKKGDTLNETKESNIVSNIEMQIVNQQMDGNENEEQTYCKTDNF